MRRIHFALLATALLAGPAMAHHSYAAFDRNKIKTITGTVRTWEMGNPHAYLWIFVPNTRGGQDIWGFEAPSPTVLIGRGFDKYTLKVGDTVIVSFNPLRDGRTGGNMTSLKLSDGRLLSTGPGAGGRPPPGAAPGDAP